MRIASRVANRHVFGLLLELTDDGDDRPSRQARPVARMRAASFAEYVRMKSAPARRIEVKFRS
jgi:hypothetical protein